MLILWDMLNSMKVGYFPITVKIIVKSSDAWSELSEVELDISALLFYNKQSECSSWFEQSDFTLLI